MSKDAIKRVAALGAVAALAAAPAAFGAQPADPGSNGQGHDNQSVDHGNSANAPGHNKDSDSTTATAPGNSADHSNAGGQAVVMYVFKGTYAGDGSVDVKRGNAHVRKNDMVDTTVAFDLTDTSIVAGDSNNDGDVTADDLNAGDKVVVKARLPRKAPGDQPFAAQQVVDQTHQAPAPPEPTI
jgi:hypothetical protein